MKANITLLLALLCLIGLLGATVNETYFGYGFVDMREETNLTIMGLGVSANHEPILCINQISFLGNASLDGALIPHNYVNMPFNGSSTNPDPILTTVCFKNFTCFLNLMNGSNYKTISSSNPSTMNLKFSNVQTMLTYKASCTVYDRNLGNASTDTRTYSVLGNVLTKENETKDSSDWWIYLLYAGLFLYILWIIVNMFGSDKLPKNEGENI